MLRTTIIRAFDGSLADAEGLLAVERATFDESPYTPEEVQTMLTHGPQRAWLALSREEVIGFVTAFATSGLSGPCWEIDLLAVHPDWTGQGLATRLIRAAGTLGPPGLRRTRAVVATNNPGSARAFMRAGFRRDARCRLWILRPKEQPPLPWVALNIAVHEVNREDPRLTVIAGAARPVRPTVIASEAKQSPELTLLLAEHEGRPLGYAELLEVQTLLYRGIWLESLVASQQTAQAALVHEALNRAVAAGLDEIGMMVPERDHAVQEALRAAGFRSLGSFDWFTAALPLPGLASGAEELQETPSREGHV
jgi:ribosomal protein S18 acetylase RimI-like enzyme